MMKNLELRLLGTGAADYDWNRFGNPGVRGSTSSLLNGHILIDCGVTGLGNLNRFGIPYSAVDTLLMTHSHDDHFQPGQIAELAAARPEPLAVYAAPAILDQLAGTANIAPFPITPGMTFELGDLSVIALPANHLTWIPEEQALHYCFLSPAGNLLYALDGAAMLKQAFQLIEEIHLDCIVIDCTMADSGDFRIFEHTDVEMVVHLMKTLKNLGVADSNTRVVLDHLARTLWPETETERQKKIAGTNFELAFDGMMIRL